MLESCLALSCFEPCWLRLMSEPGSQKDRFQVQGEVLRSCPRVFGSIFPHSQPSSTIRIVYKNWVGGAKHVSEPQQMKFGQVWPKPHTLRLCSTIFSLTLAKVFVGGECGVWRAWPQFTLKEPLFPPITQTPLTLETCYHLWTLQGEMPTRLQAPLYPVKYLHSQKNFVPSHDFSWFEFKSQSKACLWTAEL